MPEECATIRSIARCVLPVLVGPSTAVTPRPDRIIASFWRGWMFMLRNSAFRCAGINAAGDGGIAGARRANRTQYREPKRPHNGWRQPDAGSRDNLRESPVNNRNESGTNQRRITYFG